MADAAENDEESKRPQFGSRYLTDQSKVFDHNAWDDVEWDEAFEAEAREKIKANSIVTLASKQLDEYDINADKYWNSFYCQHQNKFFKDRHWLFTEFVELSSAGKTLDQTNTIDQNVDRQLTIADGFVGCHANSRIMEVGCGVGNTIFPILQTNNDPGLFVYGCDFAASAIEILKNHPLYDTKRCHAFVCDISSDKAAFPCPDGTLDFLVLIFVLSAVHPDRMQSTLTRLSRLLKPGGLFLFRDYGRLDMAQLRFKPGRCLSENFYVRGDGTRVYFFTQEDIDRLLVKCGLIKEQNIVDRRLQVNRGRQLKMYRVWVQCKYRKPKNTRWHAQAAKNLAP